MNRKQVYKLIDGERDYQDSLLYHSREQDPLTPVPSWLIYIEEKLNEAKNNVYELKPAAALDSVRKIAALAVACMEHNETKPRI